MFITYLRSSSYAAWDMCPHSYWLQYVLGITNVSGIKAAKGNIVHKALELLARRKLAEQEGRSSFREEETGEEFLAAAVTPDAAIDFAWRLYTQLRPTPHSWTPRDYRDCRDWTYRALNHNGGQFSPLCRHVLAPEQYFDVEVKEEWAKYAYDLPDGTRLEGYLALKGTIDLVTAAGADTIEYIDWKTGRRLDWATGEEKTHAKLRDDPQLRMYHYALCRLYPDVPFIVMTIFFINDGGPFSLCFDRTDLARTEDMLRRRFETVRNTMRPQQHKSWRCTSFCHYGKNDQPGTGKTLCEHHRGELLELGMDRAVAKHADPKALTSYGDGGGRTGRD